MSTIMKASQAEVRDLVDSYYLWQDQRKRVANQIRSLADPSENNILIEIHRDMVTREAKIRQYLDEWATDDVSLWAKSICGIGPVIAAGLAAHIDCGVSTVGKVWAFAGLAPGIEWKAKKKRPWNARLKTLCWKIGDSFVKFHNNPKDFYGRFYVARKALEIERNERGDFADQAAAILEKKKFKKDTVAYKCYSKGVLPPAHIDARARRYAVKIFLAHYHQVGYFYLKGEMPPKPYVLDVLGHADEIQVPNWPF